MKRNWKRMLLALTLVCATLLTACGGTDTTTTTTTTPAPPTPPIQPTEKTKLTLNHQAPVKVQGRSDISANSIALPHSASSLSFSGLFGGDIELTGSTSGSPVYFTVFVDGVRQAERVLYGADPNPNPFGERKVIVRDLAWGEHTIELVRQTEQKMGNFKAYSLYFYGYIGAKPADKDLYLEFIGDSITCGLGVLCHHIAPGGDTTNPSETPSHDCYDPASESASEEDVTLSYAYLVARALNADVCFNCYSGIALHHNPYGGSITAQTYYPQNGGSTYNFSTARKPDIVFINLGTNDKVAVEEFTQAAYEQSVKNFIGQIRTAYGVPDLKIVWTTMGNALGDWAANAIAEMNDANVYQISNLPGDGNGHYGHPSIQGHQTTANALLAFLRDLGIVNG